MDIDFRKRWDQLSRDLAERFGEELDVQAILFIIGLQEIGIQQDKLSKDQKLEVMHVGVCSILEPFGYYEFEGRDQDNWPHWIAKGKIPNLNTPEQEQLIKEAILDYLLPAT